MPLLSWSQIRRCWPNRRPELQKECVLFNEGKLSQSSTVLSIPEKAEIFLSDSIELSLPATQQQLQLRAVGLQFDLVERAALPEPVGNDELLIKVQVVGLNPIDWKASAFGLGIPSLPCVLGRDFVGVVVRAPRNSASLGPGTRQIKVGDVVGAVSTDYRDYRKAAFQQYAIASSANVYRLPQQIELHRHYIPAIGVAFATAALTLGICLGVQLYHPRSGSPPIDLLSTVQNLPLGALSNDVRDECFAISGTDRLKSGNWLAIWGGGSTVGFMIAQLAKLAGVRVVCVADAVNSGSFLVDAGVDILVHRQNTTEAIDIITSTMKGRKLRHAVDVAGKDTACLLQSVLYDESASKSHLVGVVGLPKDTSKHVTYHKVPVKLFHHVPPLGETLMELLENLLLSGKLALPHAHVYEQLGLQNMNCALQNLREKTFPGQRLVVRI